MIDNYPENFEIEVERDMACKYLRIRWLFSWVLVLLPLGLLLGAVIGSELPGGDNYNGFQGDLLFIVRYAGLGTLTSPAIAILFYFFLSHRLAAKIASSLQVKIEGPFLRIIQEKYDQVDRKLHFRSIVDYAAVDDILMRRFGLMALQMTTTGGGLESTITLIGIKDCMKVRDMLAEIDSIREL